MLSLTSQTRRVARLSYTRKGISQRASFALFIARQGAVAYTVRGNRKALPYECRIV